MGSSSSFTCQRPSIPCSTTLHIPQTLRLSANRLRVHKKKEKTPYQRRHTIPHAPAPSIRRLIAGPTFEHDYILLSSVTSLITRVSLCCRPTVLLHPLHLLRMRTDRWTDSCNNVRWQSHHSSLDSAPPHAPYEPNKPADDIETGQRRLRATRSTPHQQQRPSPLPRASLTRQLRNNALLRTRLLVVLLAALAAVLVLLLFVVVVLPASHASTDALSRLALRRAGIVPEQLSEQLYADAAALQRIVAFYTADGNGTAADDETDGAHREQLLVVHVAHGLSNRIRTFASALLLSQHFHLSLRLIWVPDQHCRATFTQLFVLPNSTDTQPSDASLSSAYPTWKRFRAEHLCELEQCAVAAQHLSDERFDVYRYLGTSGQEPLDYHTPVLPPAAGRSLYIRASTRLNYSLASDLAAATVDNIWPALFVLQPSEPVTALLDAFDRHHPDIRFAGALGLHIRQLQPTEEMAGLKSTEYSPAMWAGLAAARRISSLDYFEQLVDTIVKADPEQLFYVAADSLTAVEQLRRSFSQQRFRQRAGCRSVTGGYVRWWCARCCVCAVGVGRSAAARSLWMDSRLGMVVILGGGRDVAHVAGAISA